MTPKKFYETNTKERLEAVAAAAGTNFANFKQIALFKGSVSKKLAKELEQASGGEMTVLEILFPEDHHVAASA